MSIVLQYTLQHGQLPLSLTYIMKAMLPVEVEASSIRVLLVSKLD